MIAFSLRKQPEHPYDRILIYKRVKDETNERTKKKTQAQRISATLINEEDEEAKTNAIRR